MSGRDLGSAIAINKNNIKSCLTLGSFLLIKFAILNSPSPNCDNNSFY